MMLTTPPTASAPYRVEPDPRITSTRSALSSGTGISRLWCPVCGSLRRMPLSSTSVWPKAAPRMERSPCTPSGARSARSSEGSSLSRSTNVLSTRLWLRAGSTRMALSISSREIALHAVGRAFGEVERRVQLEQIDQRVEHQALAARRKHANGAVDLFERHGLVSSGDHHGVTLLRLLLGEGEYGGKRERSEKSEGQTVLYIGLPAMMVSR